MAKYMYEILKRENKDKGIMSLSQIQEPREPRKPRKTLEERVATVIKELVPAMINESLKPIVVRLDAMDTKVTNTTNLLNKVIKLNNLKTK